MAGMNIRLNLAYDGTAYCGWQYQTNQPTIQGELLKAIKRLSGKQVNLIGAGRTDTGVHALGQVANFVIDHTLSVEKYRDGLNFYLPRDILVLSAERVPENFHARYDAAFRRYRYEIGFGRSAVHRVRRWELEMKLSISRLNIVADYIRGEHDFSAFCVSASQKQDNRCIVFDSRWIESGNGITYEISANRFLHTMIRFLVGIMVAVGAGTTTLARFKGILEAGDHSVVRKVAPAHGLYLTEVGY